MLNSMRKSASSLFVKLLFVLLIASFAVWGIGDVLRPSTSSGVIEVGGRQINLASVDAEFRGLLEQRGNQIGVQLDPATGIQIGLLDEAISNLASRALVDNLALEVGMRIGDDRVRAFIADQMGFTTADGRFDRAALDAYLAGRRITEDVFVEQLRTDIARNDLLQLVAGGIRVPGILAETLYEYREETRNADFVRVAAVDMPAPEEPADDVLRAYYDANLDSYMAPEYRSADVVLLDPEGLAADVTVDEEQLNEEFLYQQDALYIPEMRAIEQMILADAAQAEEAAAALAEGREFASVAQQVAGQDASSLAMGDFSEAEWFVPEVADTLFTGEPGTVSDPIETVLGWRIYRLTAIEPPRAPTLDDVRDQLTREIAYRIATDSLFDLAERVQDELAGGATLGEAAETLQLSAASFGPVAADGTGADDLEALVPGGDEAVAAAFLEEPGRVSNAIDLENGGVLFIEVTEVTAPQARPFDSVRDRVVADWTQAQRLEAARALAQSIVEAVESAAGESATVLADLATEHGLTVDSADGIRRDLQVTGGLPRNLAAAMFDAEPGAAAMAEGANGEAFFVARLREIVPAPDDEAMTASLRLQLSAQETNDVFQAVGSAMRLRHEPEIQYELIRTTFANTYGG